MKVKPLIFTFLSTLCFTTASHAFVHITLKGMQAKKIYLHLTGPAVQNEGAAGHLYRKGKDVVCRYTNADMSINGHEVSRKDPRRYACALKFNNNGKAYSSMSFS